MVARKVERPEHLFPFMASIIDFLYGLRNRKHRPDVFVYAHLEKKTRATRSHGSTQNFFPYHINGFVAHSDGIDLFQRSSFETK